MTEDLVAQEWAELFQLREDIKGPEGYETWKDAAVAERIRRVKAETAVYNIVLKRLNKVLDGN
jgi:hypothetical protein